MRTGDILHSPLLTLNCRIKISGENNDASNDAHGFETILAYKFPKHVNFVMPTAAIGRHLPKEVLTDVFNCHVSQQVRHWPLGLANSKWEFGKDFVQVSRIDHGESI